MASAQKDLFVDAQAMALKHPLTFTAPSSRQLHELRTGDFIKVCALNKERFWVEITGISLDGYTGTVANDLLFTEEHGLDFGDVIQVSKRHVYNIEKAA